MLLVGFAQQQQRGLQIQPALDRAEAGGGRIHPEATAGEHEGDAEHIGLHRRQADVQKGLLQGKAVMLPAEDRRAGAIKALVVPAGMLLTPALHPLDDHHRWIRLIPVLNQMGNRHRSKPAGSRL